MAANEESLRDILERNPSLQREQFQVAGQVLRHVLRHV